MSLPNFSLKRVKPTPGVIDNIKIPIIEINVVVVVVVVEVTIETTLLTYHNHSVEGGCRKRFTSGRFTLRDLGPGPVVADDRRRVGGELVVSVAVDGDVLAVLDGTPDSQVDSLAHFHLRHNALGETFG